MPIDASARERRVGQYVIGLKHVGGGRFVRDDSDDVQFEFAAVTPAPSFARRQRGNVITETRVPYSSFTAPG